GTTLPGRVVKTLDKDIIRNLAARLTQGSALVSATNGKTTTCAMIAAIMERAGLRVARNSEGANLAAGVATALLRNASITGRLQADLGLFEVDEGAFPEVAAQASPRLVLLMNLFRDQLDRYGELEHIADRWRDAVGELGGDARVVLNADDPLVAAMAGDSQEDYLYFGINDSAAGGLVMQHASDSKYCPRCGTLFDYEIFFAGHMGKYSCPSCGNARPSPTVYADNISLDGMSGSEFDLVTPNGQATVKIPLPGLYNVYNALAAAAACTGLEIEIEHIREGLESFIAAFGRVEQLKVAGRKVCLLLVKNPAGFNEVVRTLLIEPGEKSLLLALNDKIADGRDISWIWDVDLEKLSGAVDAAICTGTRAEEMAMRLKYAGIDQERIRVQPDLKSALEQALAQTPPEETLYILPTYTAMLALRQAIHQHFRPDREMGDLVWK
ncbi:MAG: MurT ligase domain-containing protein, partial [Actinomycetota bacterium]